MKTLLRLENYLFYLFIFCIPFQTRLILARWSPLPDVSFNEWTSAFLYLTDLLVVALLLLWLWRLLTRQARFGFRKLDFALWGLLLFSVLSLTQSQFLSISVYQLAKLLEFIALFFYVRANRDKIFTILGLAWVVFLSGIFQASIAIAQYAHQASLGLRWLGESPLQLSGAGIASFYSGSRLILRPYGTLPHPNVLAAFLLVALLSCVVIFANTADSASSKKGSLLKFLYSMANSKYLFMGGYAIILYAFFLTYSRTVIAMPLFLLLVIFLITWFNKSWRRQLTPYKKQLVVLGLVSLAVATVFLVVNYHAVIARVFFSGDDEAVTLRLFYDRAAGRDFLARTWLGSGLGTFVPNLMLTLKHVPANLFQPVHNIYLLILAETGVLGLAFWGLFIRSVFRGYIANHDFAELKHLLLPLLLWSFLLIGLFDHFFWTLQQGRLLLWLTLALFW